jgi:hypothetical protein
VVQKENTMKTISKRFFWVAVYAVAMALLEAVVVIYLRGQLQLTGDHVRLGGYARLEIWREAATLAMLVAVGWLAGTGGLERLAYGVFAFGLWDIFYYAWLKFFIDWPASLLDWDVLFLIPLRWWGPVLAPVSIAALMSITAVLAVLRLAQGQPLRVTPGRTLTLLLGGLLALYVFMADALHALLAGRADWNHVRPSPFDWPLFLLALLMMASPALLATWPGRGERDTELQRGLRRVSQRRNA